METMTESGTEKRIDDLREEVHQSFARVDADIRELRAEMKAGFDKVDAKFDKVDTKFDRVDARFDAMERQMTRFFAGTLGTVIAGFILSAVTSHL